MQRPGFCVSKRFILGSLCGARTNRSKRNSSCSDSGGQIGHLGAGVSFSGQFLGVLHRFRIVLVWMLAIGAYAAIIWVLRSSSYVADPILDTYLEMAGSLIAFTFAANALVRFRGTHDRISLILAFGFVVAGLIEAGTGITISRATAIDPATANQISMGWLAGRTLLGVLLLAALAVERRIPVARDPAKEMAGATLIVGAAAYLTSVFFFVQPHAPKIHPSAFIPRAWDLFPAAIYLAAAIGYLRPLPRAGAYLDRALYLAAALNFLCHLTMSESRKVLDAPYSVSHFLMV